MGIGVVRKSLASVILVGLLPGAYAADWKLQSNLQVRETYSDNINLEKDNEESDVISEITPQVTLVADGSRMDIELGAKLQNLIYAKDGDRNSTNPQLNAKVKTELFEDHGYLDLSSRVGQQQSSLNFGHGSDSLSGADNYSDVYSYQISPRWEHNIGRMAEFEVKYSYDQVDSKQNGNSGSGGSADSQSNRVTASLDSTADLARLFWHADYRKAETDYDDQGGFQNNHSDTESMSFRGGYQVMRSLSFDLVASYENNDFQGDRGSSSPDDNSYGGGVTWTPTQRFSSSVYYNERNDPRSVEDDSFVSGQFNWSPTVRTEISGDWGSRFFGETYGFSLKHKSRRTSWDIRYSEDVTSFREQFLQDGAVGSLICPIGFIDFSECRTADVNDPPGLGEQLVGGVQLLPEISNDTYVLKQLKGSYTIKGAKNTLTLGVTSEKREFVGDGREEDDIGADLSWAWRVGPHMTSTLTLSADERQTDLINDDTFFGTSWVLSRQITRKAQLSLQLNYRERDSNGDAGNEFSEYTETRASIGLDVAF